jgi:hypothetical protein
MGSICDDRNDMLSNNLLILLSTMSSAILFLFTSLAMFCVFAINDAFRVKHNLSKEDSTRPAKECETSTDEANLSEMYSKLPDELLVPKGTNRKLSRLSSMAKSTKLKDSQDATTMLELLVNHQHINITE